MKLWTVALPEELLEKLKLMIPQGFRGRFIALVLEVVLNHMEKVGRGAILDQLFQGELDAELQAELQAVLGIPDQEADPDSDR